MWNLYESFILLALDRLKGKFLIDSLSLNYGLAGALLLQLTKDELISVEQKKIVVKNNGSRENKILDDCLTLIKSSRKIRSAKYWVNKIGSRAGKYKIQILNDLVDKRILSVKKRKVLWIFTITNYPVIDNTQIDEVKNRLVDIVLNYRKPELDELLMLSLVNSCKLTRIIFPNKNDHKKANERLKELTKNIEIGETIAQTIKEIQAAVIVASTTAAIAASSASH